MAGCGQARARGCGWGGCRARPGRCWWRPPRAPLLCLGARCWCSRRGRSGSSKRCGRGSRAGPRRRSSPRWRSTSSTGRRPSIPRSCGAWRRWRRSPAPTPMLSFPPGVPACARRSRRPTWRRPRWCFRPACGPTRSPPPKGWSSSATRGSRWPNPRGSSLCAAASSTSSRRRRGRRCGRSSSATRSRRSASTTPPTSAR